MDKARPATPWASILPMMGAIFYGVSPIDLIPDVILLLGWVDDALIIPILLVWSLLAWNHHKKAARIRPAAQAQSNSIIDVKAEPVIPNSYEQTL